MSYFISPQDFISPIASASKYIMIDSPIAFNLNTVSTLFARAGDVMGTAVTNFSEALACHPLSLSDKFDLSFDMAIDPIADEAMFLAPGIPDLISPQPASVIRQPVPRRQRTEGRRPAGPATLAAVRRIMMSLSPATSENTSINDTDAVLMDVEESAARKAPVTNKRKRNVATNSTTTTCGTAIAVPLEECEEEENTESSPTPPKRPRRAAASRKPSSNGTRKTRAAPKRKPARSAPSAAALTASGVTVHLHTPSTTVHTETTSGMVAPAAIGGAAPSATVTATAVHPCLLTNPPGKDITKIFKHYLPIMSEECKDLCKSILKLERAFPQADSMAVPRTVTGPAASRLRLAALEARKDWLENLMKEEGSSYGFKGRNNQEIEVGGAEFLRGICLKYIRDRLKGRISVENGKLNKKKG